MPKRGVSNYKVERNAIEYHLYRNKRLGLPVMLDKIWY